MQASNFISKKTYIPDKLKVSSIHLWDEAGQNKPEVVDYP